MSLRVYFFVVFLPLFGFSQHRTWLGVEMNLKPIKKTKLSLEFQHRMQGFTNWNRSFIEAKYAAKVYSGVSIFTSQRVGINQNPYSSLDLKTTTYHFRTAVGIELKPVNWFTDKSRFRIGICEQIQLNQWKFERNNNIFRSKISVKYDFKDFPLTPFVNWEHFYDFNRDITYLENEIIISGGTAALRSFGGCIIELPKSQEVQISLGRNKDYLREIPRMILAVKYSVNI